jgi:hypothetical protein
MTNQWVRFGREDGWRGKESFDAKCAKFSEVSRSKTDAKSGTKLVVVPGGFAFFQEGLEAFLFVGGAAEAAEDFGFYGEAGGGG